MAVLVIFCSFWTKKIFGTSFVNDKSTAGSWEALKVRSCFFFLLLLSWQPKGQNLSKVCQKISLNLNFLVKSRKLGKPQPTALSAGKRCFNLLASILGHVHSWELIFGSWPQIGLKFFPQNFSPIGQYLSEWEPLLCPATHIFDIFLIFLWNGSRPAPQTGLFRAENFFQACWVNFLEVLDRQDASCGPVDRPMAEYTPSQGLICAEKNHP